jgi:hypothetical protein
MDNKGTYVDIFFRNGLKEFEVLPPPDIWDNIKPVVRKRQKTLDFYRFAATAAILLSVSAFSYWFTREISKDFIGPAISLNQEVTPYGTYKYGNQAAGAAASVLPGNLLSETGEKASLNETAYSEHPALMMPSDGFLNSGSVDSRLQRSGGPRISASKFMSGSGSVSFENLGLTPEISVASASVNELNRWSISAMATPTYFSSVSLGDNKASADLIKSEKAAVSYSGGLSFSYTISKRITVQSGLYYSSVGQEVTNINSYVGFHNYADAKGGSEFGIQTSNGVIISTNNDIFFSDNISSRVITKYTIDLFDPVKADLTYLNNSLIQNFNYVEVPVLFKFKAIDRKMDLNFIGGISYNMLVGNSSFAYVNGVKYSIGKTDGLSPVNFSSSLGLGFEYNLSGKISLNLEPTVRYYLTPIGGMIGSSIHPYSFGIFSGLTYKF